MMAPGISNDDEEKQEGIQGRYTRYTHYFSHFIYTTNTLLPSLQPQVVPLYGKCTDALFLVFHSSPNMSPTTQTLKCAHKCFLSPSLF